MQLRVLHAGTLDSAVAGWQRGTTASGGRLGRLAAGGRATWLPPDRTLRPSDPARQAEVVE
eukprot:COSAG05_NODE_6990_length_870_cov_0.907912_2_plen_61_part_00